MTPLPQKVENSTLFFEPSPYTEILFQQIIISRICVGVKKWLCRWSKTVGYWTSEINKVIHFIIRKGFKRIRSLIHNMHMCNHDFLCRCLVRRQIIIISNALNSKTGFTSMTINFFFIFKKNQRKSASINRKMVFKKYTVHVMYYINNDEEILTSLLTIMSSSI